MCIRDRCWVCLAQIDRELRVRNIYSVAFLHADILINDLETLLLESPSS